MNTYQRKQLSRLIFPMMIIIAMVVLIITARRRDAKKQAELLEAMNNPTAVVETSTTTETTEADENAIPTDGDAELLDGAVTIFDGKVAVSFVSLEETDGSVYLSIRIDNMSDKDARTEGTPGVVADGTNKPINPMGKNQKLGLVEIPAGTYHIITYKGENMYMDANELVISGAISLLNGEDKEKTEYEITYNK